MFDIENFRTSPEESTVHLLDLGQPSDKGWFILGPLPGDWMALASRIPGKSPVVGLALWYLVGLTKSRDVVLTRKMCDLFGIGPRAKRGALDRLESAGLVKVDHKAGRNPRVTILDCPDTGEKTRSAVN